jgi:hypothetical protein
MSSDALTDIRGFLVSSTAVTALVPKKDITVGFKKTIDNFPCIIVNQISGIDKGYLGYGLAGNRTREETFIFSIDIYSRTNRKQTYSIADAIVPLMIVSGSCKKLNDIDLYDDTMSVYRKLQTYTYTKFHSD